MKRVNKERFYMIIKKIKIGNYSQIRISKDHVNGRSFIQIRIWDKKDNLFRPTDRPIVLNGKYILELINALALGQYLESDISGQG